jgi:hypothetical protein
MNSLTLKEKSFIEFTPLKDITFLHIPNKGLVIALADKTLTGKPTSDIIYFGKTKKPTKRILGGYLAGYGGKTNKKINAKLFEEGYLEKVLISWLPSEDPKTTQKELLETFKKEHGNYPVWNIKKPEKNRPKPQQAAAKTAKPQPHSKPATPAAQPAKTAK